MVNRAAYQTAAEQEEDEEQAAKYTRKDDLEQMVSVTLA